MKGGLDARVRGHDDVAIRQPPEDGLAEVVPGFQLPALA